MTSTLDLTSYDLLLVNTSGGKDSSVTAWIFTKLAEAQGVKDRIVLVHATFKEEWKGTVDLVKKQAAQLGLPLEVVERHRKDGSPDSLLEYARRRGKWPSPKQRWCTSDFKRAPIAKVITKRAPGLDRPARVLNVMGHRAQEGFKRAKMPAFQSDKRATNGRRTVEIWRPILSMKVDEVWKIIRENQIPQHRAYSLGMPRLSCVFCIYAPKEALVVAGRDNRELLQEYVDVEKEIGHRFKNDMSIAEIQVAVEAEGPSAAIPDWNM